MKRKFKTSDGVVGMLDTDTGDFTPDTQAAPEGERPQFPMPGYENTPPEKGLIHEDPIGDVLVGNAVAGGLPKLLEAAGAGLSRAGASATTRLAAKTAEEEAARIAAAGAAPKVPVSPVRKVANLVEKAVDLHRPLKPIGDAAARVAEGPVDRMIASPMLSNAASAASRAGSGSSLLGDVAPPGAGLLYLLGHPMSRMWGMGDQGPSPVPPPNLLVDMASQGLVNK